MSPAIIKSKRKKRKVGLEKGHSGQKQKSKNDRAMRLL